MSHNGIDHRPPMSSGPPKAAAMAVSQMIAADQCAAERLDMSWNHRVMRHIEENGDEWFGIHEVFYEDNGSIKNWTVDAMDPHGESPFELGTDLARMMAALTKPILDHRDGTEISLVDHLAADIGTYCREAGIELAPNPTPTAPLR